MIILFILITWMFDQVVICEEKFHVGHDHYVGLNS